MFLFPPIHFLKFLVKSQPQRSYKKGSYKKKKSVRGDEVRGKQIGTFSEIFNVEASLSSKTFTF